MVDGQVALNRNGMVSWAFAGHRRTNGRNAGVRSRGGTTLGSKVADHVGPQFRTGHDARRIRTEASSRVRPPGRARFVSYERIACWLLLDTASDGAGSWFGGPARFSPAGDVRNPVVRKRETRKVSRPASRPVSHRNVSGAAAMPNVDRSSVGSTRSPAAADAISPSHRHLLRAEQTGDLRVRKIRRAGREVTTRCVSTRGTAR